MTERVPSDHPSVSTVRARIERRGATTTPRVGIDAADADCLPDGDVVRVVLSGTTAHARPRRTAEGRAVIDGAFETPALARDPGSAADRLVEWIEATDLALGRTVLLDVVVADFLYGLRVPGETAVYDAHEPPSSSLADIAARVDGGGSDGAA